MKGLDYLLKNKAEPFIETTFLRGFTLVEIMIVVAVLMILLTIAIPGIMRSRLNSNEAAAIANLKTLTNACQVYSMDNSSYPGALTDLAAPNINPPYIDSTLASGTKQNYNFIYTLDDEEGFIIQANPAGLLRALGAKYFYTNQNGSIHYRNGGEADTDDPIVSG